MFRRAVGLLAVAALVAGCGVSTTTLPDTTLSPPGAASTQPVDGATPAPPGSPTPYVPAQVGHVPRFSHIYVLVLENASYSSVVGNLQMPYLNSLVKKYGLAANYFSIGHPSQPNYLALFSGSTQGVTDDNVHDIGATNLVDQLEAAGKTWRIYEQDYPGGCFAGATGGGQVDGIGAPGDYARKHDPAISFDDIRMNPARCSGIVALSGFDPAAATFELIVPNGCNDMHSCPPSVADTFLGQLVPKIMASAAFSNSVLFVTTDEGVGDLGGGGQVMTLVVSPLVVRPGLTSLTRHDHYSLLRTIEDAWSLGCLEQTCAANDMSEFFK